MGNEFKLRFKYQDENILDENLRNLPCFYKFQSVYQSYEYRFDSNLESMPHIEIRIEGDGLYICDYHNSVEWLGQLIFKLVAEFDSVRIENYESDFSDTSQTNSAKLRRNV